MSNSLLRDTLGETLTGVKEGKRVAASLGKQPVSFRSSRPI